jgi:hypothetical protein
MKNEHAAYLEQHVRDSRDSVGRQLDAEIAVAGLLLVIYEQNILILRGQQQMADELKTTNEALDGISTDIDRIGVDVGEIAAKLQAGANAGGINLTDAQALATKATRVKAAMDAAANALDELAAPPAAPATTGTDTPPAAPSDPNAPPAAGG